MSIKSFYDSISEKVNKFKMNKYFDEHNVFARILVNYFSIYFYIGTYMNQI